MAGRLQWVEHAAAPTKRMDRAQSQPNLRTRKSPFGTHAVNSIPGYLGHCPGRNHEDVEFGTWKRVNEANRDFLKVNTYDGQAHRIERQKEANRKPEIKTTGPRYDKRGVGYPPAGDTHMSRIAASNEVSQHVAPGNVSQTWDGTPHRSPGDYKEHSKQLRGYGNVTGNIPGFTGHIPGRHAENLYGDTWSKTNENSLAAHFMARDNTYRSAPVVTKEHTFVPPAESDFFRDIPLHNKSYNDLHYGFSNCPYTGKNVDPAGRMKPHGRTETFGRQPVPGPPTIVHGYSGFVRGRIGENVVGERQCKTNEIALLHSYKNSVRSFQK